jgi:hypothetical protein
MVQDFGCLKHRSRELGEALGVKRGRPRGQGYNPGERIIPVILGCPAGVLRPVNSLGSGSRYWDSKARTGTAAKPTLSILNPLLFQTAPDKHQTQGRA